MKIRLIKQNIFFSFFLLTQKQIGNYSDKGSEEKVSNFM